MQKKYSNIGLWVLQILLALYTVAGGIFIMFNSQQVTTHWAYITFPTIFWLGVGIVEIILAIGLVVPKQKGNVKNLTAISALCLAVVFVCGNFLYVAYQGFPGMLWGIVPALLALLIANQRWSK
jgi:peptidoglycan/LPS O-acetylase OafA/YrhL